MRFGVLGGVEVHTDGGRPVAVPEAKVRTLLAALLAAAGRPASAERLIDALWPEEPLPGNPGRALQAKVSQLRRALEEAEPGARALVEAVPAGYRLAVPASDATRFGELVGRARESGRPAERRTLLAEALDLWRGPAFAGFEDHPFARTAVARLTEQWLSAREELAEARLALGEFAELIAETAGLVADHPYRERLRAVHWRALHRTGRTTEALDGYQEFRELLADRLGTDPGAELASLHQELLRDNHAPPADPRRRDGLPAPVTALLGRDSDLAAIHRLLDGGRLVTLTGTGGVGKTRLALAAAEQAGPRYPDGVRLVELAGHGPGSDPAELVCAALGIRDDGSWGPAPGRGTTPAERLAGALRGRHLLLVLDNCEHLVEPVALLVGALLRAAPGLVVLTTSQEPLAVDGEALWPVGPLDEADAVTLFTSRAAASAPGFAPDESERTTVAAICRRLDGLPLALELAATRVRSLGTAELLARLDDRFRLLTAGRRDAPARQQTLRAVIDWSWGLLTEPERTVLRRLAVHAEGCTLDAAERICAGGAVARAEVVDVLARLVDRSLLTVRPGPDGALRYRPYESVTAYALEQLELAGESQDVRALHRAHYTELAVRASARLRGPEQRHWLDRLSSESANLTGSLDEAVRAGDAGQALRLVDSLAWCWVLRGRLGELRRALDSALALPGGPPLDRARATAWQAGTAVLSGAATDRAGRYAAALAAHRPARAADAGGTDEAGGVVRAGGTDEAGGTDGGPALAEARWFLGHAVSSIGDLASGEELTTRALADFERLGHRWGTAAALGDRAVQLLARGDLEGVRLHGERSAATFRELGDRWGELRTVYPLAARAEILGDYRQAAERLRDGLGMAEELGLATTAGDLLAGLGRIALLTGDLAGARELHRQALRRSTEHDFRAGEVNAQLGLALGARREGDLATAEAHLQDVLAWHREAGLESANALVLAELGFVAELRGDAEAAHAHHLAGLAAARTTGDPRALALALEGLAGAEALSAASGTPSHSYRRAAVLLGAAAAARAGTGAPLPAAERADVDRITAVVRTGLGAEAFTDAFAEGTGLTPDQALAG
ncbi:BTAD domain-containing putative transcriptional regulator [Kitasatospora sp. NPDC051853]|uniref:BTAD domain-containing putative transcriptional regulator n=1 Tax=Kitasatospora sp. NPDC051853 TaxID=3364058 RepID=UPI003788EE8B